MSRKVDPTKKSLRTRENELRVDLLEDIEKLLTKKYGEALRVPTLKTVSSHSFSLMSPVKDSEGNDMAVRVDVMIPRGARDPESETDMYALHNVYEQVVNGLVLDDE